MWHAAIITASGDFCLNKNFLHYCQTSLGIFNLLPLNGHLQWFQLSKQKNGKRYCSHSEWSSEAKEIRSTRHKQVSSKGSSQELEISWFPAGVWTKEQTGLEKSHMKNKTWRTRRWLGIVSMDSQREVILDQLDNFPRWNAWLDKEGESHVCCLPWSQ